MNISVVSPDDVRVFLTGYLVYKLKMQERDLEVDLTDDCDLLLSGLIDSLGLIELITAIQENYGEDIDFELLDPDQMTIVGPLCKFVSEQLSNL
jgi:acyl carrier protein